jgi:predicted dehydrogenase
MVDKLTVGVIGCGGMARNHVRGYLNCGRYQVVSLADLNEEAMASYEAEFNLGAKHYADPRQMLAEVKPDVVSIGVWHAGHAAWTIAAASFGPKAILCEKPMADSLQHAEQMLIACKRNGVKLVIGHQRRFLPAYTLAKDLIAQGAIGQVQMIQSFGGDGMPNYSSHQTDMYRYLLSDDECTWVMGNVERKTDRWERNTRIEDGALGLFQFAGGARAMLVNDLVPNWYQGAQIWGTEGMMDMTTESLKLMNATTGGWKEHRPDGRFFRADAPRFEWVEGGAAQADELADWVEGKVETHRGRAENGYKALEMIHAVYESARCHEKVAMPMQTRLNPLDLMIDSGHLTPQRPGRYDLRAFLLRGERMTSDDSPARPTEEG